MDIREKLKKKREKQKYIKISLASMALVTLTLATMNLTNISVPLNTTLENNQTKSTVNRLQNTDTITYIYDAADLATFRDAVNAGDDYSGKTVYLMDDIDLSTVCSETLGTWIPIGATEPYFAGTFNGNYHTISNLYISSSNYTNLGLFGIADSNAVIENVKLNNVKVNNTYNVVSADPTAGGIAGLNYGKILNCGIDSGNIKATKTSINYTSNMWPGTRAGGIVGGNQGTISGCYNKASIESYSPTANSLNEMFAGGIAGYSYKNLENCYNTGSVTGTASYFYVGGIVGHTQLWSGQTGYIKNCYNIGSLSGTGIQRIGGVAGRSGWSSTYYGMSITNSYCIDNTAYSYWYYSGSLITTTEGKITSGTLKTYTATLGSAFASDVYNKNGGYPVLAWENETVVMNLNRNQAYIKVGETLKLNVVETDELTQIIGTNYANSNFTWTSTNEDVATVDSNGKVTGISDGYTTIYAYHKASVLYAMAVINVAKDVANPQIETGNGFTAILKADGTVWTIGNNENGQLGNGTIEKSNIPVQVQIDEDTNLNNVIKIAVGTDHVVALTNDGKVYTWGLNTSGQLGQNNTTSSSYAKPVLGEDGESYLTGIVDISANCFNSGALDKNGYMYVWGEGTFGQIGNNANTTSYLPTKADIKNVIQISIAYRHSAALTADGSAWVWGRNLSGQLGINSTTDIAEPMKVLINATEVSAGGWHTVIKKIDEKLYATGYGIALGTENGTDITTFKELSVPDVVSNTNKVKYVKSGTKNITILLTDGTVWTIGKNENGELENGTTTATTFVQGCTENGIIEKVLAIGRNNYDGNNSTIKINSALITENGEIYTTGDNSYGQIGDNTTTNTTYYKKIGFVYLDYKDKTVEVEKNGYQIDLNKLKYIYSSINAYNNNQVYSLGNIKYSSLDETIATIDKNGKITPKDGVSGIAQIKIEDITNGYETYITAVINKLENTDTITYIYSAEDMVKFRDAVNAGNNYLGKTVYVMADIDMSLVCSTSIGSWEPIGVTGTNFAGTFDGNYHTISNLYASSSDYLHLGLFGIVNANAIIQNIKLNNIKIDNTYNVVSSNPTAGGIAGLNYGTILNCGVDSGNIKATKTSINYTSNTWPGTRAGGIAGGNLGTISGCYNKASIESYSPVANSLNEMMAGGIAGYSYKNLENCYNTGSVTGTSSGIFVGGIAGHIHLYSGQTGYVKNCYNTGNLSGTGNYVYIGGVVGRSGWSSECYAMSITNSYCTTDTTYSYTYYSGSYRTSTAGRVAPDTLKTYTTTLGSAFEDDDLNINNGYPILWWEAQTIELSKKQEYIKVGEELQLNIIVTESLTNTLGNLDIIDFTWTSTNEDVATVDSNGKVTGISDGYTTIYGTHKTTGIKAMSVVNVAKNVANPQVETGEGFTAILKADGTVWTIGKNDNGELGDDTNEEKIEAVQVKINENTYLTNIVKISAGTSHVLALTKDGKVYAWGANTYGQLGQNNKENSNYAKLVLAEGGSSYLERIVDISAGNYGSVAVNQFGWVLVWGNGSYGEMGNASTNSSLTPSKTTINTGISATMGAGHIAVIGQNGYGYTWGRNSYGELGQANITNATSVTKVVKDVTEVSASGFSTILKKVDGTIYASGLNTSGQLADGTTTNKTTFTKATLPTEVTETNKVKYVKAGRSSSTIMLTDGTAYTVGANTYGELGNNTNTNSSNFIQAQTKDGILENSLIIGRSSGETSSLNTAIINKNGRVFTTGSNTYGQIGNNTKENTNYFTQMGYIEVIYPEKITMNVGDTQTLTSDNFAYIEKYMNVYKEDVTKVPLILDAKIINENIAKYEDGTITAKNIGTTMLVAKEETTQTLIYIPVLVVPENGVVTPNVQTGNNFTITLKSNGTVWSFGTNENGELGIGDNKYRNVPEQIEILKDKVIEQISVGNNHVIALTQDGEIYTWGLNTNGQLGKGTTKNSNIPQKVELPESTQLVQVVKDTAVKVIANKNVSYAITQDGKVYAWGQGYGTTPIQIKLEQDIIDISESYLLDINGNVYNKETNARLGIVEKIKYISEGNTHTVFLSENGTAYAIGSNAYGQFGNGTNVSNTESVVAIRNENLTDVLRNIVSIEAGNGYTVAVLEDGTLVEFGSNQYGQLGTEEVSEINTALKNENVSKLLSETKQNIMLMDAGSSHVGITLTNGNVYTWGLGTDGQLGNGANESEINTQLVGKNIIEVNSNNLLLSVNDTFDLNANTTYFNLLQDINGEISYESKNTSVVSVNAEGLVTAISEGTTTIVVRENGTNNISVVQVRVLKEGLIIEPQVQTNGSHTITLKVDGTVWSYGNNENGELGNGTTKYSDEPVQAKFPEGTTIVQVDAGENFSIALDSEGNVWTWGANDYYQLGTSKITSTSTPTKVTGLSNITKIAVGTYNVLAIDENKEVYGWGLNSNGELGIGSYTNKVATPTKAKYLTDAIDIAVGKNHSIVLKTTGEVYVTGLNLYGQLGNNNTETKKVNTFTKVQNLGSVARITATDSGNIVSTINGKVYTWGLNIYGELGLGDKTNKYEPTLVDNIENIVMVSGGKNHSILLDKYGKVYVAGSNKYGGLGNGTNTESLKYVEVPNLTDVMTISAGNTYTVVAKTDGTVWGFGDYNHGDKTLKSKTASSVPMQVGNDTFGLGVTQITIKKSETKNISSYMEYSFNLIYLDQDDVGTITYKSLNEEIAIVNELGEILGVREGFTWVKAIEEDGTEHVVYVYVTDNEADYAPKISAGEDFAVVLKADGTMWTFGHNNNGELGIGTNRTKDVPEKTNVISSYKDISSGESFSIAIRNDGTVWSYGKNNYGQLGIGNTKNGVNPVQVNGITDIVQIATGKEHAIALDSYGILYGWGNNAKGQLGLEDKMVLTPKAIGYTGGTIRSIWAGEDQTIIINTKGEVFGLGSILNGKLEGLTNAVKASVGNRYILFLTTEGEVLKYDGTTLTKYTELAQIVDIDVKNNNNIAQTIDEKVYTWTQGETPKLEDIENIYTIATGENNSYVSLTNGTVYAKGQNQYGQLGNSTRIDSIDKFTLVGDRTFSIEPESAIMYVNDIEKLTEKLQINEFNVFNRSIRNGEEYTWVSSEPNIVEVNNGTLTAIADGTAQITITDTITGSNETITRVVIPVEKDRIESIKVNDYEATISDEYKYYVEVETNDNVGTISIKTKDNTDKISIDGGQTWYEKGTLTTQIDMINEETNVNIIVETTNGTQIEYTLVVKKISTDISLENVTVSGITATAISATKYEVVVPEETQMSEIIARANSNKAQVSINGKQFIEWKSITTIEYENELKMIVPIVVKAENGDELEYSLIIYKESEALKLENLTVDGKDAIRTSETIYSIIIARNLDEVEVTAKAISELVNVSVNNEEAAVQISTKQVEITDELTEILIRLSTIIDGQEVYRDYTLNIYKKAESGKIEFVLVNGVVITPKLDGTYETYLPAETENATVKVIAENELDYVQIETNERKQGISETEVAILHDFNEYSIIITDEDLNTSEEYKLYIKKPSVDASIKEITISNGDDVVTAKKSTEDENVYIAKVKLYDNYEIKTITNNVNAYVSIDKETKVKNVATKVVTKTADYMEIKIEIQSENGDLEEYLLKIYVMSSNATLEYIKVNETEAVLQPDGSYLANLETAETQISVTAQTISEVAEIRVEGEDYNTHIITKDVTIDAKDTIKYVYVKAEDGTTCKYKLVISGLPDDSTLQKVIVNGVEAKYIEGQNKYEIRSDAESFEITAITTDSLAKVALNNEEQAIGIATTIITKEENVTIVKIKVISQGGVDNSEYTLEIKEKSSDSSIGTIMVERKSATKTPEGNYEAKVVNNTTLAEIKVEANDSYAIVYFDAETENTSNIVVEKEIANRENVYTIKVIAEDGTEEEHTLTIIKQEANTNIQELTISYDVEKVTRLEDEEGNITENITTEEKTYTLEPKEDGTYYLKTDRVENVNVKAILEDENAKVKIKNTEYMLKQNETKVDTTAEKTEVIISVQAEDGTLKDYNLVLKKKSNDTTIKAIDSDYILKTDDLKIYVDESLNEIDLKLITNSELASIKLETDTDYTLKEITRTIDLSESTKVEDESVSGWLVDVDVQAEDGTIGNYTITIVKKGNTNIDTLKVNEETIENKNDTYTARVNVADIAKIEITTQVEEATITILEGETIIATATGTLTADVPLNENPQNYIVRVTSANEASTYDYNLVIEQKSTDTSISYVKVNNITAIQTEEGYKSVVSGNNKYPILIKTTDEKAKVKIAYEDYESEYSTSKLTENVPVEVGKVLEVTITVQSENEDEQEYKLYITRISDNIALEYVKVKGNMVTNFNELTNTYTIIIDNNISQAEVEVKAVDEKTTLTINSASNVQLLNTIVAVDGEGTTKTITLRVRAEDGTTKDYYIEIKQLSASVSLENIVVNDIQATRIDAKNYEVTISNEKGIANIIAKAQKETSKVSINGEIASLANSTKTITLTDERVIELLIVITAEDGTTEEYNLKINVIESSNDVTYVKVNTGTIEPEEDKITYKTFINYDATKADIEIKAESKYAEILVTNAEELGIEEQISNGGVLEFAVDTPEDVTIIKYKVTSEEGKNKEYSIILTKISTDNTLKELYVDGALIQADETGKYYTDIENAKDVVVKAVANNQYANIRIDYNEEEKQQTQAVVKAEKTETKVTITITSQLGVTEKYYLYIRVLQNNTNLDKVIVDSTEVTNYEENTKTYTALVENTKDSYEVFLMAVNDGATIELYDGETLISSGVGNITDILTLETSEQGHKYNVKVSLDEQNYSNYTLNIVRTSNDTSLKLVEVNDVVRSPKVEDPYAYEVGIPKLAETAKIKVLSTNSYATVRIGDNETVINGETVEINLNLSENRITIPVVVTALDGTTIDTYNILLIRQSNDVTIESVVVNGEELENKDDVYTYYMGVDEYTVKTEITMPTDNDAKIEVDTNQGLGYLEFTENFATDTIKVEKTIKVTSEDGTIVKEYKLVLCKETKIQGVIKTQNANDKHISQISLYKETEELVEQIETKEDGSYVFDIDKVGVYKIVVTKPGYLNYTITNIEIVPGRIVELEEYNLIAGDVVETGEIEIDDLVLLNDKYGVVITEENKEEMSIYDLNEDGTINKLDRDILKKNYGKTAETIEWVNPNAIAVMSLGLETAIECTVVEENEQDFILPIACEYVITSEYGYRVHPITGETKFHSGIDIVGEHHTEVLAVADGEITYAGVQSGYGNCIEIKHVVNGETIYSFYAHLSEIKVQVGEKVAQGETIGLEGGASTDPNPGTSTGHHLHFELRSATGSGNSLNVNNYIEF